MGSSNSLSGHMGAAETICDHRIDISSLFKLRWRTQIVSYSYVTCLFHLIQLTPLSKVHSSMQLHYYYYTFKNPFYVHIQKNKASSHAGFHFDSQFVWCLVHVIQILRGHNNTDGIQMQKITKCITNMRIINHKDSTKYRFNVGRICTDNDSGVCKSPFERKCVQVSEN